MKVRFIQQLVGPTVNHMAGEVAEIPDAQAEILVAAGIVEPVAPASRDERAVAAEPSRKATRR
jgi:hypothetical protein